MAQKKPVPLKTLRVRIKDKQAPWLCARARAVNFGWNYCNDLQKQALRREGRFLSAYDFAEFTSGASKQGLDLHSQTIQAISDTYAKSRRQASKGWLSWRKSGGARRSLGWIPFKAVGVKYSSGQIRYQGKWLALWDSYGLADYKIRHGSFAEDARGRWYLNAVVSYEPKKQPLEGKSALGIDLGLKSLMTSSDGRKIEAPRFYRDAEAKLALLQRARRSKRVRTLHAKIANRRKDFLHKLSTGLVRQHVAIFVGNVNSAALAKTPNAKSVLDAGWSAFRTMLKYKCDDAGVWFEEADERFSTQTCSECGALGGPKGIAGLGIREWCCRACGCSHDRDVNAARIILAAGHRRLAEGSPAL